MFAVSPSSDWTRLASGNNSLADNSTLLARSKRFASLQVSSRFFLRVRSHYCRPGRHRTNIGVCRQILGMAVFPAGRTIGITIKTQFAEFAGQGIICHHAPDERIAYAQYELQRLDALQQANDAGQHTQHAGFGAVWSEFRRGRLGIEAAITGAFVGLEDG